MVYKYEGCEYVGNGEFFWRETKEFTTPSMIIFVSRKDLSFPSPSPSRPPSSLIGSVKFLSKETQCFPLFSSLSSPSPSHPRSSLKGSVKFLSTGKCNSLFHTLFVDEASYRFRKDKQDHSGQT